MKHSLALLVLLTPSKTIALVLFVWTTYAAASATNESALPFLTLMSQSDRIVRCEISSKYGSTRMEFLGIQTSLKFEKRESGTEQSVMQNNDFITTIWNINDAEETTSYLRAGAFQKFYKGNLHQLLFDKNSIFKRLNKSLVAIKASHSKNYLALCFLQGYVFLFDLKKQKFGYRCFKITDNKPNKIFAGGFYISLDDEGRLYLQNINNHRYEKTISFSSSPIANFLQIERARNEATPLSDNAL